MRSATKLTPLFVVAVLAGACGDDDGDTSASAACDAFVAVDQAFIEDDFEGALAAVKAMAAAAPDDVADALQPLITLWEADPEAALESEEIGVAEDAMDAFALERCHDGVVEIEAINFGFNGLPAELDAGRVAFEMVNHSQTGEFHEALLLRLRDGVEGSPNEVLAGGLDTEVMSVETTLGAVEPFEFLGASIVEPGDGRSTDVFVVDLEPGEYILACILPVGSPELIEPYFGGEPVEAVSHFSQGMFAEFTVR